MIKDNKLLRKFEDALTAGEPPDYRKNLRIAEALYREARSLRVFPGNDPLEGIDTDIRLARILNSV